MSVRHLRDPTLPIGLAEELESFMHVLIYNGVRFLFHTFDQITGFVDAYFDGTVVNDRGQKSAPHAKTTSITQGQLTYDDSNLVFTQRLGHQRHPMNGLLAELFTLFRSRYRVLRWEAAEDARKKKEALSIPDTRAETAADYIDLDDLVAGKKPAIPIEKIPPNVAAGSVTGPRQGADIARARARWVPRAAKEVPTQMDREHAAKLETHDAVIAIFQKYITNPTKSPGKVWPMHDKLAFDRLYE